MTSSGRFLLPWLAVVLAACGPVPQADDVQRGDPVWANASAPGEEADVESALSTTASASTTKTSATKTSATGSSTPGSSRRATTTADTASSTTARRTGDSSTATSIGSTTASTGSDTPAASSTSTSEVVTSDGSGAENGGDGGSGAGVEGSLESQSGEQVFGREGPLVRYSVTIEAGIGVDLDSTVAEIDRILGDERSWIGFGDVRLQRVAPDGDGLSIKIASPSTVDQGCLPLRTLGRLSCRQGSTVWLNVDRWQGAVAHWTADLAEYRAYLINHEVGHYLGRGHQSCPGEGQPAPVMQQQSKSLGGCLGNGWPSP